MTIHIARNDALYVAQVTTLNPTAANSTAYELSINGKIIAQYTSDGSGTDQEIVEALVADLDNAINTLEAPPEILELTSTEDNVQVIATGLSTGKPFTLESTGAGTITIANTTEPKSPNHWIAENFDTGTLPGNTDTVILDGLTSSQSFKYGLNQSTVTLTTLDILATSAAEIGLPEINTDNGTGASAYYQGTYRETHLRISATNLHIGKGLGSGSRRIKLDLGTNACNCTIYSTSTSRPSDGEAPVHLIGAHASNQLHVMDGIVDVGVLPSTGSSCTWPLVIVSNGTVRFGDGCTLTSVEAAGESTVEIRSAVTTMRTRGNGSILYLGSANLGTVDIDGNKVEIRSTAAMTITQLNGYGGKELDLTLCEGVVTATDITVYGTPANPFTIRDPNNKFAQTNAASCPNGAQSLIVITGSGRTVKIA